MVGISLKPEHLKRYKDIVWLLFRYGRSDLVTQAGLDDLAPSETAAGPGGRGADGEVPEPPPEAAQLADDLEQMGPTFIKLGQLLSTRPDVLPPAYADALARLQDRVAPFPYDDVERIVEEELGVRISKAFASFEREPLAAASLGQVHRAALRDGRAVAVKVQRPNIRHQVLRDLEALREVAGLLERHSDTAQHFQVQQLLDEFGRSLMRELDYRREAANLTTLGKNLEDFAAIVVPAPVDDYTSSRVLTMEYIHGQKVTSLSPLARLDVNGPGLADQLFRAYLKQILVDGFFHADPHPGNVFLTDDGRLALLDLGMVAHLTPDVQDTLLQFLIAMGEGRGQEVAYFATRLGERQDGFDESVFRRRVAELVSQQQGVAAEEMAIGRLMMEVTKVSGECHIRVPPELAMLGKTLLNLDQAGTTLDPRFDANAAIRRHAAEVLQQRLTRSISSGNFISAMMEMRSFLETLPRRMNAIMERVAANDLTLHVEAFDERRLMEGLQKIANRITVGLILAALIVGAAMLMSVPTDFRILGYPGLAMIFFVLAAGGGTLLLLNILFNDERRRA